MGHDMLSKRFLRGGFTIVELMAVVAILSVLATVAVVSYKRYMRRARIQEGVAFLMDLKMKQETYFMTYSRYVSTGSNHNDWYPPLEKGEVLPKRWGWDCQTTNNAAEKGLCALGFNIGKSENPNQPPYNETYFQYVTIGWYPGCPAPPKDFINNPSKRWWFARGRTFFDTEMNLPVELRVSSELTEIIQLE